MKRPVSLVVFFASTSALFLSLTIAWTQVAAWTSYPVARIAQVVLDSNAPDWVEVTQITPQQLRARTKFRQALPDGRVSTPIAGVDPAHYAYGISLFLALLIASRSQRLVRRATAGYCILLIPQAFSLILVLLGQIVREVPLEILGISVWQADAIMVGNMFGMIVLPTLAPVVLWLWFEGAFFRSLIAGLGLGVDSEAPSKASWDVGF